MQNLLQCRNWAKFAGQARSQGGHRGAVAFLWPIGTCARVVRDGDERKKFASEFCSAWSGACGRTVSLRRNGCIGGSKHELVSRTDLHRICGCLAHCRLCRILAPGRAADEHPARCDGARRGRGSGGAAAGAGAGTQSGRPRRRGGQARGDGGCRDPGRRPSDRVERGRDRNGAGAAYAAGGSRADEVMGLSQPQLHDQRHALSRRGNARVSCARL